MRKYLQLAIIISMLNRVFYTLMFAGFSLAVAVIIGVSAWTLVRFLGTSAIMVLIDGTLKAIGTSLTYFIWAVVFLAAELAHSMIHIRVFKIIGRLLRRVKLGELMSEDRSLNDLAKLRVSFLWAVMPGLLAVIALDFLDVERESQSKIVPVIQNIFTWILFITGRFVLNFSGVLGLFGAVLIAALEHYLLEARRLKRELDQVI